MESLTESNQFSKSKQIQTAPAIRSRYDLWKMYSHKSCNQIGIPKQHSVIKPFVRRKSVSPINRIYSTNKIIPQHSSRHNSETNLYSYHHNNHYYHNQQQQQQKQNQQELRRNSFDGGCFGRRNDNGGGVNLRGRRFVGGGGGGTGGYNNNGNELWNRSAKCIVCVSVFNIFLFCLLKNYLKK